MGLTGTPGGIILGGGSLPTPGTVGTPLPGDINRPGIKDPTAVPANTKEGKGNGEGKKGEKNRKQDKKLSPSEIEKLKKAGSDPEELKGGKSTGKLDLYKDPQGNIIIKPKGGAGPGEPTGINIYQL